MAEKAECEGRRRFGQVEAFTKNLDGHVAVLRDAQVG